jgi:hypothetical protein
MALSHVWSNARRVITQGLVVTFDKELRHAVNSQNISHPYWHYKRRRTMEMEYLGLTRSGAEACAAAWSRALYRKVWRQVWIANASPPGDTSGKLGYWSSANSVADWNDESQFDFIHGGTAELSYDGGKGWRVKVSIDETLPYNHKTFIYGSTGRGDYLAFENNPEMVTTAFRYGADVADLSFHPIAAMMDFSLDAIEYQLAITGVDIVGDYLRPAVVCPSPRFGMISRAVKDMRLWWYNDVAGKWESDGVDPSDGLFVRPSVSVPYKVKLTYPISTNTARAGGELVSSNILEVK